MVPEAGLMLTALPSPLTVALQPPSLRECAHFAPYGRKDVEPPVLVRRCILCGIERQCCSTARAFVMVPEAGLEPARF